MIKTPVKKEKAFRWSNLYLQIQIKNFVYHKQYSKLSVEEATNIFFKKNPDICQIAKMIDQLMTCIDTIDDLIDDDKAWSLEQKKSKINYIRTCFPQTLCGIMKHLDHCQDNKKQFLHDLYYAYQTAVSSPEPTNIVQMRERCILRLSASCFLIRSITDLTPALRTQDQLQICQYAVGRQLLDDLLNVTYFQSSDLLTYQFPVTLYLASWLYKEHSLFIRYLHKDRGALETLRSYVSSKSFVVYCRWMGRKLQKSFFV